MPTEETDPAIDDEKDLLHPHEAGAKDASDAQRTTTDPRTDAGADRLHDQAERVLEEVRKLGTVASETAGDALGNARSAGREAVDDGRSRVRDVRGQVESYVEREPLKALLFAAGAGAVLGLWSRR